MRRLLFLVMLAALPVIGCGGSDDNSTDVDNGGNIDAPPQTIDPTTRVTENFGENGNLWKPVSDEHGAGGGNLVVLINAAYREQFDNCEVPLRDGTVAQLVCIDNVPWTHVPFSCFGHNDRQTWRAAFRCGEAAEVKVVCRLPNFELTVTVPEAQRGNVCSRFG